MTRSEFLNLSAGQRLELVTGDIVEVKSASQQTGIITFEYLEMPKALVLPPPQVVPMWGSSQELSTNVNHRAYGLPGAPAGMQQAIETEMEQYGKTPTTVTCYWSELANASLME